MDPLANTEQGTRSLELPQELIDAIVEYLWNDREALKQCCLTSRSFRPLCQKFIFECVRLNPTRAKRSDENASNGNKTPKAADVDAGGSQSLTMAQRLNNVLQSSPYLPQLIKDLRICNVDDIEWETSFGWLEDDDSLSHILPLLVNLERFYVSGSLTDDSRIEMTELAKPVRDALFTTWKSPKLTHIGIHCVVFESFEDLSSILTHSTAVRDITLCFVDVGDDEDLLQENTRDAGDHSNNDVDGKPVIQTSSAVTRTSTIDSLALFAEPEVLSRIYDLPFFHQILRASPSLEELHITMLSWVESAPRDPIDISSLRVVHMAIDLGEDDDGLLPTSQHPTLRWWCDSLTSTRSLNLTDLDIYLLTDYDELEEAEWQLQPEWNRLDEILSSGNRSINLKIRIMEDEPEPERVAKPLKPLENKFLRMSNKGRLDVGYMQAKEIFCHFGVHWVQES
ncbi:hypothetical protein L218DRAFT_946479 [Marasmius fiardii PR-910]|nr:hypothetical protein L218DRAFT_946479 [Marasmius fiardii PR-910]